MVSKKEKTANLSKQNKSRAVNNTAPQKQQPRKKTNKKKKRNIAKILKWTCLICLIIGAIVFLLTTPIFNVTRN